MQKFGLTLALFICLPTLVGFEGDCLHITVCFQQVHGLVAGDRVLLNQDAVGLVETLTYTTSGQFQVILALEKRFGHLVTTHSRFIIGDDIGVTPKKAIIIIQTKRGGTPIQDGAIVDGSDRYTVILEDMKHDIEESLSLLKQELDRLSKDLQKLPENQRFEALKKELKEIVDKLISAGEETKQKIRQEILPLLQKEMEKLRKHLRKYGREEEMAPLDKEMKKINLI